MGNMLLPRRDRALVQRASPRYGRAMVVIPVLYSFRRCPYAMRARMALAAAEIPVALREVLLKEKPAELIAASPKATVPVLVLKNGIVIEESLEIMRWALDQNDPLQWKPDEDALCYWVTRCDGEFKHWLDRYKYADRHPENSPEHYRNSAEQFIRSLESALEASSWMGGPRQTLVDIAVFPFVRQFAAVDPTWWQTSPYPMTRRWLDHWLDTPLFSAVMKKFPRWTPEMLDEQFPPATDNINATVAH